jgi:hypothetical protein
MSQLALGYVCVHATKVHASDALAEQVARLLTDPRWPWQPTLVRPTQFPRHPLYPWPKGKVRPAELFEVVRAILRSDDTLGINLHVSGAARGDHAWLHVESGQTYGSGREACPGNARAMCRAHDLPPGKTIDGWIELMHELSVALATPNAAIIASDNEAALASMLYGTGGGPFPTGQHRDVPRYEIARVNQGREGLGAKFARPAAWGTYLKPEHVAAIGGRARITEVVAPPVMKDVGSLLYIQLSARAEDALAPETLARKRAFWELLAPPVAVPFVAMG